MTSNNRHIGYTLQQLRIDLSKKSIKIEKLDPIVMRKYLGGVGYSARVLYDEGAENTQPLEAESKIVISIGPLTLRRVPGGGSVFFCFKSPLTRGWAESRCGGDFGIRLREAGYDSVILQGRAEIPIYIVIENGSVSLKPAKHLSGKLVSEKIGIIQSELADHQYSMICIGPAGENCVKFATVMCGHRAAGRCGAGALLGSKNVMGIAVKGTNSVYPAKPEEFDSALQNALRTIRKHPGTKQLRKHGTTGDMGLSDDTGDWPTKNWQSNSWGKARNMYDYFYNKILVKNNPCYHGCPVACGRIVEIKNGPFKTPRHEGAEYESVTSFTAAVFNENIEAAVQATYLCNEYGIDTISTGSMIAFAMECFEKGILKYEEAEDLDLSWGNAYILPELVKMIALRKGVGHILAEGVKEACKKIGHGSCEFAIHGKGLEAPMHDPRSGKALAVTYATANRGMCHCHPLEGMAYDNFKIDWGMAKYGVPDPKSVDRWDESGKGNIVRVLQDGLIACDILGTCKMFPYCGLTLDHYSEMLSAFTGWDVSGEELLRIGERVINLQRMFNVRHGFSRKDDILPERMKKMPAFGNYKDEKRCAIKNFDAMMNEYYRARGWSVETGIPTPEKLKELGI
jgi:aldehyde:ferredoxin oxidoreductase